MEPVEITAGRRYLRSPVAGDWPAIHVACQDPAIQQWTTVPAPAWAGALLAGEVT